MTSPKKVGFIFIERMPNHFYDAARVWAWCAESAENPRAFYPLWRQEVATAATEQTHGHAACWLLTCRLAKATEFVRRKVQEVHGPILDWSIRENFPGIRPDFKYGPEDEWRPPPTKEWYEPYP